MKRKSLLLTAVAVIGMGTASMAQVVPNYVPTNGLVGWWPFNGNANDESGNGNNGTVNGATLTADRFGDLDKAYYFDGNDFIQVPNTSSISNLSQNFTVSVWVFRENNEAPIISKSNFAANGLDYRIFLASGYIEIACSDSIYVFNNDNVSILALNNWSLFTIVKIGSLMQLYIDGVLLVSSSSSSNSITNNPIYSTNNDLYFGVDPQGIAEYMIGIIDDIGIWNRALTECEIQQLYNSQLPNSTQNQTALDSYTWPVNGQTYTQGGTYTATLPNAAGCDSIVTLNLTLSFIGINEQTGSNIVISPNPANDYVMIRIPEILIGQTFAIVDNSGRKILSGRLSQAEQKIEIGHLSEGMYVLQIHNEIKQSFRILKK
jgi:hypothetical protein